MEIKTANKRIYGLIDLYDLHTNFFKSALEGISDEDANKRLETKANHIAWIAGSMVQERYELANIFGEELKATADQLFANHKGIENDTIYPSLADYKKDWEKISPILRAKLEAATDEELDKVLAFPGMKFSVYEMTSFQTYREANCIGQIALWRRLLGYEGMKYM